MTSHDYLVALANASNVFFNYSGAATCANLTFIAPDDLGKDILWCNELIVPFGQSGVSDMFFPRAWNETEHTARCQAKYGLTPQYDWMADHFGGRNPTRDFKSYTNII
jgi:lysosomal Pro-X carboxypeptidase